MHQTVCASVPKPEHMIRLIAVALLLLVAAPVLADPGSMLVQTSAGQSLLEQGRAQMIAFRLVEAERTFERLLAAEPESPAAAFHLAKIAWWRAITMEQEPLYDAFFDRAEAALSAAGAAPAGPWPAHFRSETELFRASIHAKQGAYARAAMSLRRAYLGFQRNVRNHPDFLESRWGMGLCYATVGSVPRQYRWVLRLLGFGGTVSQGMEEIRISAERSRFYRDEAAIYYAILDEVINESRGGGMRYLRAAFNRNPDSPVLQYLMGFALLNERQVEQAEAILLRADAALQRPGVYPIPYVDYYLGDALFRQNRFAEAAGRFERFLDTFPGQAHRAQAALHAGLAREMMGDRAAALKHYRSITVREDFDSDASARREAAARLEAPLTDRQRDLLRGRNAFDGGRYREAVSSVQHVLTDRRAPAIDRAEAAYRSGRAFHALERWDDAIRHYQFAVVHPGDPLAKWGPWSQFYIAEVHRDRGDTAAARAAYQLALSNDQPFEYHKGLEQRARTALEQL